MRVYKSYRFRLYPDEEQTEKLARQFGACRFVYNYFLEARSGCYDATGEDMTYQYMASELAKLKAMPGQLWLRESNAQSLQVALRNLDTAFLRYRNHLASHPNFKSKKGHQSFSVPQGFKLYSNHLKIPKMLPMKIERHRRMEGKPRKVVISKTTSGNYYASFLCLVEPCEQKTTGGIANAKKGTNSLIEISGKKVEHQEKDEEVSGKLRCAKKHRKRCAAHSRGREDAELIIARLKEHIANKQLDYLHKLSRQVIDENQAIYLAVRNMAGSPGCGVWGELIRQLKYKGAWYGCSIIVTDKYVDSGAYVLPLPGNFQENHITYLAPGSTVGVTGNMLGEGMTADADMPDDPGSLKQPTKVSKPLYKRCKQRWWDRNPL
jgi:putative transposase